MRKRRGRRQSQPIAIEPTAVYTQRELAGVLRLGQRAMLELMRRKVIRYRVEGNRHLFLGAWILAYLRGGEVVEGEGARR